MGLWSRHFSGLVQVLVRQHNIKLAPYHCSPCALVSNSGTDYSKGAAHQPTNQTGPVSDESSEEFRDHNLWKRRKKEDPVLTNILQKTEAQKKISQFAKLMNCDETMATELIRRNSILVACGDGFHKKIELLLRYGFSAHDIISNPSVLHRTHNVIEERLQRLQKSGPLDSVKLSMLKQPDRIFDAYLERRSEELKMMAGFSSRTQFLANLLKCDASVIEDLMKSNKFLSSISLVLVHKKVSTLLQFQLTESYIRRNIRILQHLSILGLKRRLDLIQSNNLSLDDTYLSLNHLLTCSDKDFMQSLEHASQTLTALEGCEDKLQYLTFRLGCSNDKALQLASSQPVNSMSVKKLKTVLDFFLTELNVSPDFVIRHRRLLAFSVARLRRRWKILCAAGDTDNKLLPCKFSLTEVNFNKEYGVYEACTVS